MRIVNHGTNPKPSSASNSGRTPASPSAQVSCWSFTKMSFHSLRSKLMIGNTQVAREDDVDPDIMSYEVGLIIQCSFTLLAAS